MKKMIIAAIAFAFAATTQAASVTWQSGKINDYTGAAVTSANAITGYLYSLTAVEYATYAAMDAETLSQTVGQAYVAGELGAADKSGANSYTSRGGATLNLAGLDVYGAGDTAYGLVLYVDSAADMYLANVAQVTLTSNQSTSIQNLANVIGGGASGTATAWAAVPEPTSGLLLLLGMAGLALKRKRA